MQVVNPSIHPSDFFAQPFDLVNRVSHYVADANLD